ncbi:hydrogenase subunit MbhD domain-containing protein [Azotobacter salinestris]|uniref:hydrogenase subunit MbhD domain-containing protein n=1 Tax=Azotobacter salinestris TaxID=69964 RepID=UPI0032DE6409
MAEWLLDGTLGLLLLGLAGGSLLVSSLYAGILLFMAFGLVLALVWARLGAPDLALAEAAIGAGLTGVLLFAALARQEQADAAATDRSPLLAAALVVLPLALLLLQGLAPSLALAPSLPDSVRSHLPDSGVSHPVTAVLLNFRAWDTLLELAVLLLALLGARQLGPARFAVAAPWPLLQAWSRLLAPLLVLTGGYLLWRGSHAPGGAFQGGALFAAALVLLRLAGLLPALRWSSWPLRLVLLIGLLLFLAVAAGTAWLGAGWLSYPPAWAGALILAIETAAILSIAFTLSLLVIGEEPPA